MYCVGCRLYAIHETDTLDRLASHAVEAHAGGQHPVAHAGPNRGQTRIQEEASDRMALTGSALQDSQDLIKATSEAVATRMASVADTLCDASSPEAVLKLEEIQACIGALKGLKELLCG